MGKLTPEAYLEAALFIAQRPLNIDELIEATGLNGSQIERAVEQLEKRYAKDDSGLTIVRLPGKKYVLEIKKELARKSKRLAPEPLLTKPELRTLAYIAHRQPITKAKVVRIRGTGAYKHIASLLNRGFIKAEPHDKRTVMLTTTSKFAKFFGFSEDPAILKRQLVQRMPSLDAIQEEGEKDTNQGEKGEQTEKGKEQKPRAENGS